MKQIKNKYISSKKLENESCYNMKQNRDDLRCAPSKKLENGSCYTIEQLKIIAENYNKYNDKNIKFDEKTSKKRLLYRIIKQITNETNCDNQICWLKQDFINKKVDDDMLNNTFRPIGPANQGNFKWLSNFDIQKVMKQYEYLHKDFKFLGAVPIDFEDINYINLKYINLENLYNEKPKLGLIINLDRHDQSGSHWVSLYINLKTFEIYFSDSGGNEPSLLIKNFIKKIVVFFINKKNSLNNINNNVNIHDDIKFMCKKKK